MYIFISKYRFRDYKVSAIVMIEFEDTHKHGNAAFLREHLHNSSTVFSSSDEDVKGSSLTYKNNHNNGRNNDSNNSTYVSTNDTQVENEVPKIFSFIQLPAENCLHDWYAENDDEFTALFDHMVSSSERKPSSY
jgi:hypothetical protein